MSVIDKSILPLVSIIIPVYNSEKNIFDTIESCINQTYTNIEIIVINDGSKDNSENIIKNFSDNRLKYFSTQNFGACHARNIGIKNSSGKLIQFLDADDLLHIDKIKNQVSSYLMHGNQYIYSSQQYNIYNNTHYYDKYLNIFERNFSPIDYLEKITNEFGKYLNTGVWLLPRQILDNIGLWDESLKINQDGDFFIRAIINSNGIKYSDSSIFYYRRDSIASVGKSRSKEALRSWLYSYEKYQNYFFENFSEDIAKDLSWKTYSKFYCSNFPNEPELLKKCEILINNLGFKKIYAYGGNRFVSFSKVIGVKNTLFLMQLKKFFKI